MSDKNNLTLEEIKQEIWDAYSAVNMEFLMDSPLATSGESKKVDRDELNNFVYTFAEDAVGVLDNAYYLIALMRANARPANAAKVKPL